MTPWWSDDLKAGLGAGVGALGTAAAAWLARRRHPRLVQAEISDHIAGAFQKLVDELQQENARLDARIEALRAESHGLQARLARLQAFARALFAHVAALEARLRSLGVEPPPRPPLPDRSALD